jgi:hypothetical protein
MSGMRMSERTSGRISPTQGLQSVPRDAKAATLELLPSPPRGRSGSRDPPPPPPRGRHNDEKTRTQAGGSASMPLGGRQGQGVWSRPAGRLAFQIGAAGKTQEERATAEHVLARDIRRSVDT